MASPQEIIKSVASHIHQNVLKDIGFKKSGTTWVRGSPWVQVLNIQSDRWNTAASGRFTMNLGVFIPEFHDAMEDLPVKGTPKEYDCDIRSRIGDIMPGRQDFWWNTGTQEPQLFKHVLDTVQQIAVPWLERISSSMTDVAAEFRQQNQWLGASIAYALLGDKSAANECMAHKLAYMNPATLPKVLRLAEAHGIELLAHQIPAHY